MAIEFPSSLIKTLQIGLRKEAGISSYDPDDPSLLRFPTLDEAIAQFDPSPSYLRCKQCHGKLLRGIQSMICVYCGAEQRGDAPPPLISFNSTFAYRKLLESLQVDGSEVVSFNGASDSTGSRNASREGLVLSDLLDLELKWPEDVEESMKSSQNKVPTLSEPVMNMAGVDLDNFFSDAKSKTAPSVSETQLKPNEQIKSTNTHVAGVDLDDFFSDANSKTAPSLSEAQLKPIELIKSKNIHVPSSQESNSMSQNLQPFSVAVNTVDTTAGQFGEAFSLWEAEFQSASSGTLPVESKSVDRFLGSSTVEHARPIEIAAADMSIDTKLEIQSQTNSGESKSDPVHLLSMIDNWMQDDLWHSGTAGASNKMEKFEISNANDGESNNTSNHPPSVTGDWNQDDFWHTSTAKQSSNTDKTNGNDVILNVGQDFSSSGDGLGSFSGSYVQTGPSSTLTNGHDSETNFSGLTDDSKETEFGSFLQPDVISGASSIQKGSTDLNIMQMDTFSLDRMEGKDVKTGVDAKSQVADDSGEGSTATGHVAPADPNVEMLMSQMHDLSFMLETNLSIPKKVKGTDSISWP
ncbi:uncharacterized protein LOC143879671 [Tasmannia lanceolata]|uniref:uncharacterized protein LOC143879671 n=1 Tax=Tasmannia lanceolata TaxID=3420 RepID=UPI004062A3B5